MNLFLSKLYDDIKKPLLVMLVLYLLVLLFLFSSTVFFLPDIWRLSSILYLVISTITLLSFCIYGFSASLSLKRDYQQKMWPLRRKLAFYMPLLSYLILFIISDTIMYFLSLRHDSGYYIYHILVLRYALAIYLFMCSKIAFNYISGAFLLLTSIISYFYFSMFLLPVPIVVILCVIMLLVARAFDVLRNKWHWYRTSQSLCLIYGLFLLSNFGSRSFIYNLLFRMTGYNELVDLVTLISLLVIGLYIAYVINDYQINLSSLITIILLPIVISLFTFMIFQSHLIQAHIHHIFT